MKIQALVLCGGKGERLRPLTSDIPKPMIKIKDKTILEYIIDHILFYDIEDLILLTGYQSNVIESYIGNKYNNNILFSNAGDVDIIERIKKALKYINGDFLLFYGDTISDVNINNLITHHNNHNVPITMTVWPLQSQFGVVEIDSNNTIFSFKEKPVLDKWINIGYFYFKEEIITLIKEYDKFELFLLDLINQSNIGAYKHTGAHITVNTMQELEEAENNIDQIQKMIIRNK